MNKKENKKWTDNIWFVRLIALVFAVFLYAFVGFENNRFVQSTQNASVNVTETISNVPVMLGDVDDDVFVSNLPESVSLRVTGPQNIISQVLAQDMYVITEDLTGADMGRQQVRLQMPPDLQEEGVEYQITPSRVIVDIGRLATVEHPVEFVISEQLLADGYELVDIQLEPEIVTLSGKEETINQIDRVYVRITSEEPITESFTKEYPIEIRDQSNNLLDVSASLSHVTVSVNVQPTADASASVQLEVIGEDLEQFEYHYEQIRPNAVQLQGHDQVINQIQSVVAVLDMSEITESGVYSAQVQLPDQVEQAHPTTIDVRVVIEPKSVASQESISDSEQEVDDISVESSSLEESLFSVDETISDNEVEIQESEEGHSES